MSMFEASIRGHTADEDVLTSYVFGVLRVLDSSKYLIPVLGQCGVSIPASACAEEFTFEYWKPMGERTPDVIIRNRGVSVFIESKLGSPAETKQLVEEYQDGAPTADNFWLVLVTADNRKPTGVDTACEILKQKGYQDPLLRWTSWQQIYQVLKRNQVLGNCTERKLVEDLLALLRSKGLRMFEGFSESQAGTVAGSWPQIVDFFDNCSALLYSLSSRLKEHRIECEDSIRTGRVSRLARSPKYWVPRWLMIRAWDEQWDRDWRQCLIVLFVLHPFTLNVGYRLALDGENRKLWDEFCEVARRSDFVHELLHVRNCSIAMYAGDFVRIDEYSGEGIDRGMNIAPTGDVRNVIIGRTFQADDLGAEDLTDKIEDCLLRLRDSIVSNRLHLALQAVPSSVAEVDAEDMSGADGD